jgi:hypothetical protein
MKQQCAASSVEDRNFYSSRTTMNCTMQLVKEIDLAKTVFVTVNTN